MQLILPEVKHGQPQGEPSSAPARPRKKRSAKRVILIVVVLAVAAAAAWGVKALFFDEEEQIALTETTTYGSLATTIEGTGITLPADSVTVTTASTSEIEAVYVSAGDTVEAGDLLYVQDDSELDDQIEEYQDSIAELEDEIDTNQQQRDELLETLSNLTVTAPFSGRIVDLSVEEGDDVMSGTVLAQLVDDSKMTLTQYFSYAYEDEIYVGMKASLSIPSLMRSFDGTVTEIQKVDRVTAEVERRTFLDSKGAQRSLIGDFTVVAYKTPQL